MADHVPSGIVPPAEFEPRGPAPTVAAPAPSLQNHGGPLLGSVEVVPIYWGAAWSNPTNAQLASDLDAFFDFVLTSEYMDLLAEYGTAATAIGHGRRLQSVRIAESEPGATVGGVRQVTDAQIRSALQGFVDDGTLPETTPNTLYFVYLPPEVASLLDSSRSCAPGGFCGYHNHASGLRYAVVPFADCQGCVFPGELLDTLTVVSSHELAEAITDPDLDAWWDGATGEEIGDICNRDTVRLGRFLVQTEWSNAQGACAVAPATAASPASLP